MADQADIERGARMRAIREERGETQEQFAEALNGAAEALNLPIRYGFVDVSRRETARKTLDAEDYVTVAMLDPQRRGMTWVAFGQAIRVGRDAWELLAGQQAKRRSG